jgi:peptide chain release factor 3
MGKAFKGVYNLYDSSLLLFSPSQKVSEDNIVPVTNLDDPILEQKIGRQDANQLREDVELLQGVYGTLDTEDYLQGKIAPLFFGSAVNNFGVQELLDTFIRIAPPPQPRQTNKRIIRPEEDKFTGFIFKIHANLDPRHRDRIAFLRVCSGKFKRNTFYKHSRLEKDIRFSSPYSFLAREKDIIETAYPGDVVGLFDTGNFKIGDTLTEGEELQFTGIPTFSPELFRELVNKDPMKTKQLEKGIRQLTDEGVAQMFTQHGGNRKIIGCVGDLQFEVIQYRLLHEYGASCSFIPLSFYKACWITGDKKAIDNFVRFKHANTMEDKDGNLVYLAESEWFLNTERQNNPDIEFHFTSEFKTKGE